MGRAMLAPLVASLVLSADASASTIVDRNATRISLRVDGRGFAAVSYRAAGRTRHVLAWGAINDQLKFKLDYSGGSRTFGRQVWRDVRSCLPYDGPALAWLVAACKAPDGSYWALQRWQRLLPSRRAWELHLSHWRGPLPQLEIYLDWVFRGRYHHLFGRYHYNDKPVHGRRSTRTGKPLDPFGRNIYLDVLGSARGQRWVRENAFLAHRPSGTFCYGFYPRGGRPPGHGQRYRATAIGPGVSPDAYWEESGLGAFDPEHEAEMNRLQDALMARDKLCRRR
jgi:hypothetical protein